MSFVPPGKPSSVYSFASLDDRFAKHLELSKATGRRVTISANKSYARGVIEKIAAGRTDLSSWISDAGGSPRVHYVAKIVDRYTRFVDHVRTAQKKAA